MLRIIPPPLGFKVSFDHLMYNSTVMVVTDVETGLERRVALPDSHLEETICTYFDAMVEELKSQRPKYEVHTMKEVNAVHLLQCADCNITLIDTEAVPNAKRSELTGNERMLMNADSGGHPIKVCPQCGNDDGLEDRI
jgi:hypothetical protein